MLIQLLGDIPSLLYRQFRASDRTLNGLTGLVIQVEAMNTMAPVTCWRHVNIQLVRR